MPKMNALRTTSTSTLMVLQHLSVKQFKSTAASKFQFVGERMKKYIANIISSCRILFSLCLLFCPAFSVSFYSTYILCGFTDMVDGTIARKTNAVSEFGARLDTASDFLFFALSLIKLLPIIHITQWMWVWIVVIAIIKICNLIFCVAYKKKIIFLHTVMNKITGLLLFLLPLTLQFIEIKYSLIAVCIVATISAIQEGYLIIKER